MTKLLCQVFAVKALGLKKIGERFFNGMVVGICLRSNWNELERPGRDKTALPRPFSSEIV
ncbi:MAG: hypothetical protein A3C30_02900 [Candidatus Levybacteria bacterium RIFCSPHIGHO2_02_FULL_40_18]|nr:MAG: hypothetical protein A2869_05080 [Candidatus Levybacteria bacterium RIFCSPHIGHO2_01_FULL_40_58]OGH26923.1 MAG: hypothetical protein A3C30_02900 [Candidatus Levybacteria bacterium RIFCSPHIGHO2_02_FULL_40_18]OGH32045.1 MAG: hypothetical protein A3E43_03880 [Candidatus Levybacteria bacterium RIFCSPHIGHO2_12_FULL_40_31]OGH40833.1 MAG: hypothetical protein A2894_04520 [Candidatus Levybacteria bacterium RIFCSPLOWO2_01_FULL_40_64]OGH48689.1 MAG: hypothetical protein A3I54_03450 [Candidatus Lev